MFKVMDLMHEALHDGIPTTKRSIRIFAYCAFQDLILSRDMYYKDVTLFKKQSVVDKGGNISLVVHCMT